MPLILVRVAADRTQLGDLQAFDDSNTVVFGPVPCYCKADNAEAAKKGNPTRNPELRFGDTPTGTYNGFIAPPAAGADEKHVRMFGPSQVIALDPVAGQALRAKQNGRTGILIHGGALSAAGKLRPTFGCVRLANEHQAALLKALPAGKLRVRVEQRV